MKKIYKVVLSCLLPIFSLAQKENIETDRPSESFNPNVVLKKHFQVEVGFRREHKNEEGQKKVEYLYPSALLKYGVTNKLELRMLLEDKADYDFMPEKQKTSAGLQPIELGLKYSLWEEKGFLPKTSLVAHANIPKWASKDYKADFVAPLFRLVMENTITDKLKLEYNLGEEWDDDDVHGRFIYSLAPQWEVNDNLHLFIETYGFLSKNQHPENVVDAGILYQVKPNIQVNLFGGVGLSSVSPKNFIEAGLSFRLPG